MIFLSSASGWLKRSYSWVVAFGAPRNPVYSISSERVSLLWSWIHFAGNTVITNFILKQNYLRICILGGIIIDGFHFSRTILIWCFNFRDFDNVVDSQFLYALVVNPLFI